MVGVPTNRTPSMLAIHRVLCQRKHEGIVSLCARGPGMKEWILRAVPLQSPVADRVAFIYVCFPSFHASQS